HIQSVTDAALLLPGGGTLGFWRNFHQAISGRYASGMLGLGWTAPWQSALVHGSDDSFTLNTVGEPQDRFSPDSRGGYFSQEGSLKFTANLDGTHTLTSV